MSRENNVDVQAVGVRQIDYRRVFPWIHLFRAFRIATGLQKLVVAGLGLTLLSAGQFAIDQLPFASVARTNGRTNAIADGGAHETGAPATVADAWGPPGHGINWPWDNLAVVPDPISPIGPPFSGPPFSGTSFSGTSFSGPPHAVANSAVPTSGGTVRPSRWWTALLHNGWAIARPMTDVFDASRTLMRTQNTWDQTAIAWSRLIWTMIVWAVFGGALSRMAALQFARDESVSVVSAIGFALERILIYLTPPLLVTIGIGFFYVLCLGFGLVGRIPHVGGIAVGILWIAPMLFATVMLLIVIGAVAGWPLMFASISVEGSDGFQGFSRAFNFLFSRPWHWLWNAAVSVFHGAIMATILGAMLMALLHLAEWAIAAGMGAEASNQLFANSPSALQPDIRPAHAVVGDLSLAHTITGCWMNAIGLLLAGFHASYFWSGTTINYLLLRQREDAVELDEIYVAAEHDGPAADDDAPRLFGVAASDQPVIERPLRVPDTTNDTANDAATPVATDSAAAMDSAATTETPSEPATGAPGQTAGDPPPEDSNEGSTA